MSRDRAAIGVLALFVNVTTSLAVVPGWISGVCFPSIRKSCWTWPTFLQTNVTLPGFAADLVESLKKNSPLPLAGIPGERPARAGGLESRVHDKRRRDGGGELKHIAVMTDDGKVAAGRDCLRLLPLAGTGQQRD